MAKSSSSKQRTARSEVTFFGANRDFWRLMIRGNLLLMLTLGLYRFWLVTDVRRFLWNNTEIGGEAIEYSGTALELLAGFLIAMALLVPLYGGFFLATLDLGLFGRFSGAIAFLALAFLGQFAIYRARRYRLTRTIHRGLRLRQTGSAWRYSVCAVFWWTMIILTFGLLYPLAMTRLEQFKMDNTFYGDLPGGFEGTAMSLFGRGIWLWLLVTMPLALSFVVAVRRVNWGGALTAFAMGGDHMMERVESASPGFGGAVVIALIGCIWAVLAAALIYPAFQALVLRWWLGGMRFGSVAAAAEVKVGEVYAIYVCFLWVSVLFSIVAAAVAGVVVLAFNALAPATESSVADIVATVLIVGGYVIAALAYSAIYQVTVKLAFWRLAAKSVALSGTPALDRVKAVGRPSSAFGEGLADALSVGGW